MLACTSTKRPLGWNSLLLTDFSKSEIMQEFCKMLASLPCMLISNSLTAVVSIVSLNDLRDLCFCEILMSISCKGAGRVMLNVTHSSYMYSDPIR